MPLGLVLAGAVAASSAAGAPAADDVVCLPYLRRLEDIAPSRNTDQLQALLSHIPKACADTRRQAQARIDRETQASRPKRPAPVKSADGARPPAPPTAPPAAVTPPAPPVPSTDDSVFEFAKQTGTFEAFSAYISQYPYGQHVTEAREGLKKFEPIVVTACNETKVNLLVAESYLPTDQTQIWRHTGWTALRVGQCLPLFQTRNENFYLRAEEAGNAGNAWGDLEVDKRAPSHECMVHPGPYDLFIKKDGDCPTGVEAGAFLTLHGTLGAGPYTFRFR